MMSDLKLAFRSMKYASNKKVLILSITMLFVIGILNIVVGNTFIGLVTFTMAPYMLIQLTTNFCMSGITGVSPKMKRLHCGATSAICIFAALLGIITTIVIILLGINVFSFISMDELGFKMCYIGIINVLMCVYMVVGQKFFYASFVGFMAVFVGGAFCFVNVGLETIMSIPVSIGVIFWAAGVVIGIALNTILNHVFVKYPWDPRSMRNSLGGIE